MAVIDKEVVAGSRRCGPVFVVAITVINIIKGPVAKNAHHLPNVYAPARTDLQADSRAGRSCEGRRYCPKWVVACRAPSKPARGTTRRSDRDLRARHCWGTREAIVTGAGVPACRKRPSGLRARYD